MSDEQLTSMVNMMKANPSMLRQQYETMHGRKMSDAEFEQILANLSPETMKMGMNMAKSNPELIKQAQ